MTRRLLSQITTEQIQDSEWTKPGEIGFQHLPLLGKLAHPLKQLHPLLQKVGR
ncbi:MAG: Uncharacterised protein [Synechococcus sp. MIT S9220]|nr:MAG: Uncharacterised protein [Synechococcus sp. MIT S9220]